ncbi:MAG: hypothetical protein IJD81_04535 [Oscillospiraceae bacterium]|nr:hypothetical protein [Oscillospiraceae bacterium]
MAGFIFGVIKLLMLLFGGAIALLFLFYFIKALFSDSDESIDPKREQKSQRIDEMREEYLQEIQDGRPNAAQYLKEFERKHAMHFAKKYEALGDDELTLYFYGLAAEQKIEEAYLPLAKLYEKTAEQRKDSPYPWADAAKWYTKAYKAGFCDRAPAINAYRTGKFLEAKDAERFNSIEKAIDLYIAAGKSGHTEALLTAISLLQRPNSSYGDLVTLANLSEFAYNEKVIDWETHARNVTYCDFELKEKKKWGHLFTKYLEEDDLEKALKVADEGIKHGASDCAYLAALQYYINGKLFDAKYYLNLERQMERRDPNYDRFDFLEYFVDDSLDKKLKDLMSD